MIINLDRLLDYYQNLFKAIDNIYPEKITMENIYDCPIDLDMKHPAWVKSHFPLMLIHYREKAGKLRNSKSLNVIFQNSNNILTQLVCDANSFGILYRKNKHKGYPNIVAAISVPKNDVIGLIPDMQKPKKFKSFIEFSNVFEPGNSSLRKMCEILEYQYPCNSQGQLKLI